MKLNKCIQLGLIGIAIFIFGTIWNFIATISGKLIIVLLPTYQILELMGVIIFTIALYCKFKEHKKESEEI